MSDPEWLPEAIRLRNEGLTYVQIGAHLGVSKHVVRLAIVPGAREATNARIRARKAALGRSQIKAIKSDWNFVAKHKPRPIRNVIDREAVRRILAERDGGIQLAELRARIAV